MGDDDRAHPGLAAARDQQIQHLNLDRRVQAQRRIVGQDHARLGHQRHGDDHALRHAARQLVRIGLGPLFWIDDAHLCEQSHGLFAGGGHADVLVRAQHVGHLRAHRAHRIQQRLGIRPDQGDLPPAHAAQLLGRHLAQVAAADLDRAAADASLAGQKADQRAGQDGFAGPCLAHDAQHLVGAQCQADTVQHGPVTEGHRQVAGLKQGLRIRLVHQALSRRGST